MQMESQTELLVEQTRALRRRGTAALTSLQRNSCTVFTSYCMQGASQVPLIDYYHAIAQTTGATNWLEIRKKFVGEPIEDSHLVELFP
jgi:hypothetical protein